MCQFPRQFRSLVVTQTNRDRLSLSHARPTVRHGVEHGRSSRAVENLAQVPLRTVLDTQWEHGALSAGSTLLRCTRSLNQPHRRRADQTVSTIQLGGRAMHSRTNARVRRRCGSHGASVMVCSPSCTMAQLMQAAHLVSGVIAPAAAHTRKVKIPSLKLAPIA